MKRAVLVLLLSSCLGVGTAWALFESKAELVSMSRITLVEAVEAALRVLPGKAVEAYIEKEDGKPVFEVKIVDGQNEVHEVYVDADSGQVRTED